MYLFKSLVSFFKLLIMAKSRAAIQKAYRERKKAEGSLSLEKERRRQKKYRKYVSHMTLREVTRKREMNRMHCETSRQRRREIKHKTVGTENSTRTGVNNEEPIPGTSVTCSPQTQEPQTRELMTVHLQSQTGKQRKIKRSRALRRANAKINLLEREVKKRVRKEVSEVV